MNRQQRLKEISDQLHPLLDEQQKLRMEEVYEYNKSLVGKYFKEWHDTGNSYTIYVEIDKVDEFGNAFGREFRVYDSGRYVSFSPPNTNLGTIPDYWTVNYEITPEEFLNMFYLQKKNIFEY